MKKLLAIVTLWLALAPPVFAVNVNIDGLPAATSVGSTDLFECEQGGINNKCTAAQAAAFVYGLMSGDATTSGTGTFTLATVNANVGSFGSATNCVTFTTNAKGLITAASATTCTPGIASVTGLGTGVATALGIAPGTTGSFTTQNGAIVTGNCLKWGPGITDAGATCGTGGGGAVSSVSGGIGVTVSPTTGSVVVSSPVTTRNNTTTSDTITSSDKGTVVTESNAASVAVNITTAGFVSSDYFTVKNLGAGVVTYTPSAGTIDGAGTLVCAQNQSADVYFNGTNYFTLSKTCGLGALATVTPGTGVATAAAANLSAAGGLASTIASGTAALGTSAIAAGTCGTATTVSATGVATTDTITVGFNGDPTATTGYLPTAMLTLVPYPTANNINIKQCNLTGSSITPAALTVNWRVGR